MISILILTCNGARTLPALLDGIARQKIADRVETVAVDSGSTDGTRELLAARVDRLIDIAPQSFNHGLTRNLGMDACRGELVVLTVQDAEPDDERWLAALTRPFRGDDRLAGTYARQIPRPDASAISRHYLARYVAGQSDVRAPQGITSRSFSLLTPSERFALCTFDNVCSCVRRSIWQTHPFAETPIAEDLEWARTVLLAGFRLLYVPDARVRHSHDRSPAYEFRRTYLVHQRLSALFNVRTIPHAGCLPRAIASSLALHLRLTKAGGPGPRRRSAEVLRGVGLAVVLPLGQYLGARSVEAGLDAGEN